MFRSTTVLRAGLGLALVLAAVAAIAPIGVARAQDNGLASITIYAAVCPPDYAGVDYFADCYGNPGSGYTFNLAGPGYTGESATTGESGLAWFEGIDADGTYTLTEIIPVDIVNYVVGCSAGGVRLPLAYVAGGVQIDLTTSDDLRCDWYNIPIDQAPPQPPAPPETPLPPESPAPADGPMSPACPDAEEWAMLTLINGFREENGLGPLTLSATLTAAAEFHSQEMADEDYLSHTLQGGVTWSQNMNDHGYGYETYRGENIAAGNSDAQATFEQWVNSSGHRDNMLNPNYTAIGIGRANSADTIFGWYWTTDFGGVTDAAVSC